MSKIENKTLSYLEMITIIGWYKTAIGNDKKKEAINKLPFKLQLTLKRNIDEITRKFSPFEEFRNEKAKEINDEFVTDDKTEEAAIPQLDENGKEMIGEDGETIMVTGKRLKKEYEDDYNAAIKKIDMELRNLAMDTEEVQIRVIPNIYDLLDELPDDIGLNTDDITILGFMEETESDK